MRPPLAFLRRPTAAAAVAVLLGAVACSDDPAPAPPSSGPTARDARPRAEHTPVRAEGAARVEAIAGGLEVPWDVAFLPDGRALVTELRGRIRLVGRDRRLRRDPLAQVPVSARGEGGLMGVAVDPAYAQGRRFVYVYATTASGMEVQRWRMAGQRLVRDGVVLSGVDAGEVHDSGRLRFGPDRRLYVATGDAGRRELAQQPGSPNGKFLRLSPGEYRSRARRPTIHSIGHRNPQGLAWQPGSNRLFATEHGPSNWDGPSGDDEVNVIRKGADYGWPAVRGPQHGRFAAPVHLWSDTVAPSGAEFVSLPGSRWTGDLLVATLAGEALHRLDVEGARVVGDEPLLEGEHGRLRAVVEAPDGAMWVTTSNRDIYGSPVSDQDDKILRVVPPAG